MVPFGTRIVYTAGGAIFAGVAIGAVLAAVRKVQILMGFKNKQDVKSREEAAVH